MKLIVVSNFLAKKLNKPCEVIHDGYHFERQEVFQLNNPSKIKVGIVGRVTNSKGIHHLIELLKLDNPNVGFHLFGHMDSNLPQVIQNKLKSDSRIIFHDFKQNKIEIYQSVDLLLHLNEKEPLGRIFFEALDFGIPIIGFNHGGIGEIGNIVEYPYLVNSNDYNKLMDYIQYLDFSTELL
jgi:glycosyltransferase involved in cell wall biosynthesis